ncbi:MAG: Rrf2 family transcriptional regulator [Gemmatimonadota bacterium]
MLTVSRTAEYPHRAADFIAEVPGNVPVRVRDIAAAVNVPRNCPSRTLHQLARAGAPRSTRGPLGGFRLAQVPARPTLAEVVGPAGRSSLRDRRRPFGGSHERRRH